MVSMDDLASSFAATSLDAQPGKYEKAFNRLVEFAEDIRGPKISGNELKVTKELAGPFTSGGLLVLLLEPLRWHPWKEGVDRVISGCGTLDLVEERICIGSRGSLSLEKNVSLLDSYPLLAKEINRHLEDEERNRLRGLVADAIEAKRPDVILCMGTEAARVLFNPLRPKSWEGVQIITTRHPGYFLNYVDDEEGENLLFNRIYAACHHVQEEDASRLVHCLDMLMKLCFEPSQILPTRSVNSSGLYHFLPSHLSWLKGTMQSSSHTNPHVYARACLIRVFRALNRCVTATSLFSQVFNVDWESVYVELDSLGGEFEDACYLLASAEGSEHVQAEAVGFSNLRGDMTLLDEFERVLLKAEEMWNSELHPLRRWYHVYPEGLKDCVFV